MRRALMPFIAAACAGVAVWCSIGVLAVTNGGPNVVRVGLLPPVWLLPLLVLLCIGAAWIGRLSPRTSLPLFFSLVLVLPWIPGPVPAVFLVWTGHVAVIVWIAIAAAMLAARGTATVRLKRTVRLKPDTTVTGGVVTGGVRPGGVRLQADHPISAALAAAIACVLYIGSAWWLASILPGGDEPHYLIITQSLLHDRDLQIENNHARADYAEYFRGVLRPDFLRRGTNGQIYSIHAPGLSALIAPAYALLGYHGVVFFLSAVAGIGTALLWFAAYRLTGSVSAAWFAWAALALTVPFFFEAFAVYPDGVGATLALFAALPLLDEKGSRTRFSWLTTGIALAALPWLHSRFAIISAVLGLCLVLRLMRSSEGRANLVPLLSVPVVGALAWFAYFRVIYGTFNPAAPYGGYTQTSAANILTGLPALLFDQQFGILPNAPVYGFCLVGMIALARRWPRLAVELTATALTYLLATSAYYMWWAGSVAPARFAVPVLPLLVLPSAWLWKSARHAATRALGMAMLLVSVAITAILVGVDHGRLAYNFRDGYSLVAEWLSPLVDLPQGLPTFFRQTSGGAVLRAALWMLPMALVWFALRAIERRRPANEVRPALALATPACLAVATMMALAAVWTLDHVPGPTPETSELALLQHFDPRIRPTGINFTRLDPVSAEEIVKQVEIVTPSRRPKPAAQTLLLVPGVLPAGQYVLEVPNPAEAAGMAALVIGRNARPIMSWNLRTDLRDRGVRFELPVNVDSIAITGDAAAARATKFLSLRPIGVLPPGGRLTNDYARRAGRYGPGFVFFLDAGAFVEDPGFWVRGGGSARVAVVPLQPDAPLQLFVRNSPEQNRVEIDIAGETKVLELQPREERLVPIGFNDRRGSALIRISSQTGFQPSQVESGSTDNRYLGVWIELRE